MFAPPRVQDTRRNPGQSKRAPYRNMHHCDSSPASAPSALRKKLPGNAEVMEERNRNNETALVVRFLTRRFIWEYDPTLESTYRHQASIDDEVVAMEILDTAGQEDVQQKEGHMRWGDGFIIVYDITDRGSFEEVAPLRVLLEDVKKPKNVPLVLVGNKSDLEHVRQVSTEDGERLAAEMGCAFYECSACADEGGVVAEAFHELCREVRRRKAVQGKARRRSSTTHVKQAINKMLTKISS
uniref:Ras-related and estrogen-regulated growth inhibitor n=2 Tax=Kryptolebias marmoratus TaxID=37003 RepID=A0A3Q3A015_KRYMA